MLAGPMFTTYRPNQRNSIKIQANRPKSRDRRHMLARVTRVASKLITG